MAIVCKSQSEIDKMRRSGHIVRQVLDELRGMVAPGVSTMDLEKLAERRIKESGAKPAFKDITVTRACCARQLMTRLFMGSLRRSGF